MRLINSQIGRFTFGWNCAQMFTGPQSIDQIVHSFFFLLSNQLETHAAFLTHISNETSIPWHISLKYEYFLLCFSHCDHCLDAKTQTLEMSSGIDELIWIDFLLSQRWKSIQLDLPSIWRNKKKYFLSLYNIYFVAHNSMYSIICSELYLNCELSWIQFRQFDWHFTAKTIEITSKQNKTVCMQPQYSKRLKWSRMHLASVLFFVYWRYLGFGLCIFN